MESRAFSGGSVRRPLDEGPGDRSTKGPATARRRGPATARRGPATARRGPATARRSPATARRRIQGRSSVGILDVLRAVPARPTASDRGDTDTVKRIVAELDSLPAERARFLAAFAYVLSRVAHADSRITADETDAMREIVQKLGHVPEAQAVLVVEIAKHQARLFGGTENYLVTREFRELATAAQRLDLLDCVFAVAASDGAITSAPSRNRRRGRSPGSSGSRSRSTRRRLRSTRSIGRFCARCGRIGRQRPDHRSRPGVGVEKHRDPPQVVGVHCPASKIPAAGYDVRKSGLPGNLCRVPGELIRVPVGLGAPPLPSASSPAPRAGSARPPMPAPLARC